MRTGSDPATDDFEAFYRANVDRVYRALAVTLRRDELAQEAVDEAMARAYAKWATVRGLDNPAGWVFRVGLNWATSFWRKVHRERPPRHRRRRHLTGAAVAVLAVLGAGALLRPGGHGQTPVVTPSPSATSAAPLPPAQPLVLADAAGTYRVGGGGAAELGGAVAVGELTTGGTIYRHRVMGADSWNRAVPLPDGRVIALGPAPTGTDVYLVETLEDGGDGRLLTPYSPRGTTGVQRTTIVRNVRHQGEPVALLTADSASAYLWRPGGLYLHDMTTTTERAIATPARLGVPGIFDGSIGAADLVGHQLVISPAASPCALRRMTYDRGTPEALIVRGVGCEHVNALRLSPDGRRIGVAYQRADRSAGIAVVSTGDGHLLAQRELTDAPGAKDGRSVSMGWQDNNTLRAAAYPVGAGSVQQIIPLTVTVD